MRYFDNIPNIIYDECTAKNIFKRIILEYLNPDYTTYYKIERGEKIESISFKLYGTVDYWWLLCLINNINDMIYDLPLDDNVIASFANSYMPPTDYIDILQDIATESFDHVYNLWPLRYRRYPWYVLDLTNRLDVAFMELNLPHSVVVQEKNELEQGKDGAEKIDFTKIQYEYDNAELNVSGWSDYYMYLKEHKFSDEELMSKMTERINAFNLQERLTYSEWLSVQQDSKRVIRVIKKEFITKIMTDIIRNLST